MSRSHQAPDLAARLHQAQTSGLPLVPPTDVPFALAQGYQAQRHQMRRRVANGARVVGWKVGVTSRSAQLAQSIDHPVAGYLLADAIVMADTAASEAPHAFGTLIAPRVEIEIAFLLAAPLTGPGLTVSDVLASTTRMRLALEIVDSRWMGGAPNAGLLVADNVSNAGVVLGPPINTDADLGTLRASLTVGKLHSQGGSDQVLGHPALAVAWLAEHLAEQGESVRPGELVLSGTLCPPLPLDNAAANGETVDIVADFTKLGELRTRLPMTNPGQWCRR